MGDLFQKAVEIKQQKSAEFQEWNKEHHSSLTPSPQSSFDPMGRNGVQYLEAFAASPAAHGMKQTMNKQVSMEEHSDHMHSMEDADAIVRNDLAATTSLADKISAFQRLS